MIPKELYIIGNGFDIHHDLETRYQLFAFFLQDNYDDLYQYFITYYPFPDIDRDKKNDDWNPVWSEFEKRMAELDYQSVLDDNSHLMANVANDDFNARNWYDYQTGMEEVVDDLTKNLFKAFKEFILSVNYPADITGKKLKLDPDGYYISFNYTNTLERYYGIAPDHILYIHNKATDPNAVLILGHGIKPEYFKEKEPVPPEGLTSEEIYDWNQRMADNYDHSYELAKQEILQYFANSFKNTATVIKDCAPFFERVKDADRIVTMGHSLSDVDKPYLQHIAEINDKQADWSVSYWSSDEKTDNQSAVESLGVPASKINMYKLVDRLEPSVGPVPKSV